MADCSRGDKNSPLEPLHTCDAWDFCHGLRTVIITHRYRISISVVQVALGLRRDYVPGGTVAKKKFSIKLTKLYNVSQREVSDLRSRPNQEGRELYNIIVFKVLY
jgi:hypothetical protein